MTVKPKPPTNFLIKKTRKGANTSEHYLKNILDDIPLE